MSEIVKIRKSEEGYIIERFTYPRFRAIIKYKALTFNIFNIDYLDNCGANAQNAIIQEIEEFIVKFGYRLMWNV